MKIAIISKLWEKTDPNSTGGTGMSVGLLVNELVKQKHQVTLFATGDSKTKAKLISIKDKSWKNDYSEPIEYLNIAEAFSMANKFDIIHCHVEQKAAMFANLVKTPTLLSLRYGEFFKDEITVLKKYKNLNWTANSQSLTKKYPFLNFIGIVKNGLALKRYPFNNQPKDYFLFLSRLSPQKRPDIAIEAAKKSNVKLILAGKTVEGDKKYLQKIFKEVDSKNIIYKGEVGFKKKIELLKNAKGLLHPNDKNYFEACSNTILEAQACGTPVIAFDNGSNKELVIDKKIGFVVKSISSMADAIKKINSINRKTCRQNIVNNFSVEKMTKEYIKLYNETIKNSRRSKL